MMPPDKLLTNPIRLAVVAYLNQVAAADFTALQNVTEASKGNLSIQLKKLQEVGYIIVKKSFKKNYQHTRCLLTSKGHEALEKHVAYLKKILDIDI